MNFLRKIWFLAKKKPLTSKNRLVAIIVYAIGAVVFPIALQVLWLLCFPILASLCLLLITIPILSITQFLLAAYCIAGIIVTILAYNQDEKIFPEQVPDYISDGR